MKSVLILLGATTISTISWAFDMRRTIRANTSPIKILSKIELHHEIGVVQTHSSLEVKCVGDVDSVCYDHVLLGSSSGTPC